MRVFYPYLFMVFLTCILAVSLTNSAHTCKKGCSQSDDGILKYQPGNVYEYNFDSTLTVGFGTGVSIDPDDTSLKILGVAKVFAEGNCGYTLQIHSVKVSTTKEAIEKKLVQNIQKPVYFSLVNGKLEPELCGDSSDSKYSLNIKRALISLLQCNTEDSTEIDVFGQCETQTSFSKTGGVQVLTKVRDLNKCAYRENTRSGLIHGIVNQAAGIKSSHLFKASYIKESKISNGVVENVRLVEDYAFDVTEKSIHSVRGKIATNLKVKNTAGIPATAPQVGTHGSSVIFQKPETYKTKNLGALKMSLTQLVELLNGYVKKDSAKAFTELIRLMRNADTETLLELATVPHQNTGLARKVYMDALFRTGTAESVKAILKQISKMDEQEKLIAIISLNLVQTVDKDTLNQAAILLGPNAAKQVYLSIGTLVAKYCNLNRCEVGDLDVISKKFVDNLKHCKANTKKDEERIVYVLRGIDNMGHLTNSSAAVLAECASSSRAIRIRVAALQAFASASCDPVLVDKALDLLRDRNEDSEIRIEAYLAAINCPTTHLAIEIANIVNSEPISQVGGFIASSLQAIRDSTDDYRAYQRYHLGNIRTTKRFPVDPKRYSYNKEVSYKLNAIGMSASSDYKLIYSQHGFLPRSVKLNVSTELFGTNFNIFEVSARQENIENILEYYLGPKGLLNKDFDEIMKMIEVGGVPSRDDRTRRSIADETMKFSKKYKTYAGKSIKDVNLDFSLKFFGSEFFFLSLGDQLPSSLDDIFKYFSSSFDNVKKELSSFNKEFTLHDLFLDLNAIYPTGLGIPLELNTQGFSANKLDFGINLDVDAIIEENWLAPKYHVKLVPSADITLKLQLGFNAYVLATGLQLELSMHSAAGGDIKFDFSTEGNGFNLHMEPPRTRLELIDIAVSPGFYVAELDKTTKHILTREDKQTQNAGNYHMCFNQFESVGLNLCIDAIGIYFSKANTANINSLVHPISLNVYAEVEEKYDLRGSYLPQTNIGSQEWKLELNTLGPRDARTTSVTFELGSDPRSYGRLAINSPIYNFAIEAGLNNDEKELVLYLQYESNDNIKRNIIGFLRNGNEYRPIIEIRDKNGISNEINGYRMAGKVVLQKSIEKKAEYIFENFQITNKANERVVINGWMGVGPAWLDNELNISIGSNSYLVKGNLKMYNGVYDIGLFTNDERSPDNVYGGSAHVQLGENMFVVHLVGAAAAWEIDFNNKVEYHLTESTSELSSSSFQHDISIKNKNNFVGSLKMNGLTSGIDKLELTTELMNGKSIAALSVKYNGNRYTRGDYDVELHGKYNKDFADLIAKCNFNGNRYIIDNTIRTSLGTAINVKGEVGQRYTAQDIYIDVNGIIQLSKKDKQLQWIVKVIGSSEKATSEIKISHDSVDLLLYSGELQHLHDKLSSGKINISFKNVATAKGEFRVSKNGKGESNFILETQKSESKHKLDINSKFQLQAPKYEIETTIFLDGVKQLFIKTDSHMDEIKFSTKNLAEVSNKKIAFDAQVAVNGDLRTSGDIQGNFVLTCATGHVIDGNMKHKVTTNAKNGNIQANIDVLMNEIYNGKKQTFLYTANTDKLNFKTKEILHNVQVIFTNFDNKKVELAANVKHLPKDQFKSFEIQSSLRGDFFNIPANANFVVDQYDNRHATFRIELKLGSTYNSNVNVLYNLGSKDIPAKVEVQGNAQLTSGIKTVQLNANSKLIKPNSENGNYVIELHVEESASDGQFFYWNTVLKSTKRQGSCAFDWETKDMHGPLKLDVSYQNGHEGTNDSSSSNKQRYSLNFNYDSKFLKTAADLSYIGLDTASVHYTLDSSFGLAKNVDVDVRLQKLEANTYEIKWKAKSGDSVYSSNSKIYQSQYKKGLDLHVIKPRGDPIVVVGIFEISGQHKSKLLVKIENIMDLDFSYDGESLYKAGEDFYIKAKWNSAKLSLQNYDLDVHSQGNSIVFYMKHAQGVIFAGSAAYSDKKENSKRIIEGRGQVQYKGKPQKVNFRLIHQIYDLNVDKEIGFSYTLDGTFGPKKGVSSLKISNKDVDVKLSICEEKKQCTNIQVQSIVFPNSGDKMESPQHSLIIVVDLRELGYPYEFEFQSKTIRQGLKLQYSLESQMVSSNNLKYKIVANILPTNLNIQLKMPRREVLLEAKQQFPPEGEFFGYYENSIAFYFDKTNKPNEVTRIKAIADVTSTELAAINVSSEIKFEHPTIRPLTIRGKFDANYHPKVINSEVVFDIFCLPEHQIIASLRTQNMNQKNGFNVTIFESLYSTGIGFNYEFSGHAALNFDSQIFSAGAIIQSGESDLKALANIYTTRNNSEVSVYVLNEPILLVTYKLNREKHAVKVNNKLQIFSQAPIELITDLQPTQLILTVKQKGLINLNADVNVGKELKLNIQGLDKQLFDGRISLDAANFLQTTYESKSDDMKSILVCSIIAILFIVYRTFL